MHSAHKKFFLLFRVGLSQSNIDETKQQKTSCCMFAAELYDLVEEIVRLTPHSRRHKNDVLCISQYTITYSTHSIFGFVERWMQ